LSYLSFCHHPLQYNIYFDKIKAKFRVRLADLPIFVELYKFLLYNLQNKVTGDKL
jgi:hypothetical protein